MRSSIPLRRHRGTTLIEVLVTMIVLSIGLLGAAALQSRLQKSGMEGYQRAQALMLLDDMANRIATNRNAAASYVTNTPLGTDTSSCASLQPSMNATQQQIDAKEWCQALQGAAETTTDSGNVGGILGARGCVQQIGTNQYLVSVAWQGLTPISAPAASCGQNNYDISGTDCTSDRCRRVVTTVVRVATLL